MSGDLHIRLHSPPLFFPIIYNLLSFLPFSLSTLTPSLPPLTKWTVFIHHIPPFLVSPFALIDISVPGQSCVTGPSSPRPIITPIYSPRGRHWGANYVYGTSNVVCGLAQYKIAKSNADARIGYWIQKAVDWLTSVQNRDGGWGEALGTYRDPGTAGQGQSTTSQTA